MHQETNRKRGSNTDVVSYTVKKLKTSKNRTELKDVVDDCLIEIFTHFSIKDLVNIVRYDENFLTAARVAFNSKFSKEFVPVLQCFDEGTKGILWTVDLLENFGHEIKKLSICCGDKYKQNSKAIDDAIVKNCQKNLLEIRIGGADEQTMSAIETPFEKVTKVSFCYGSLCPLLLDIGKWFPNAETLELRNMISGLCYAHEKIPAKTAPKLKHLDVHKRTDEQYDYDYISEAIIEANPQLQSLSNEYVIERPEYDSDDPEYDFDNEYDAMHYENAIIHAHLDERLPHLESLRLFICDEKEIDFIFESPAKLEFKQLKDLYINFYESTALSGLPIYTEQLEKLTLIGSELGDECVEFIRYNKTPSYIKLVGKWSEWEYDNVAEQMIELLSSLPNLNELHFPIDYNYSDEIDSNNVVSLLKSCKHLRKLVALFDNEKDREQVTTIIDSTTVRKDSEWKTTQAFVKEEYKGINEYFEKCKPYQLIFDKVMPPNA